MKEAFMILVPRKARRSGLTSSLTALLCALLLNGCAMMPVGEIVHPGRFEFGVIGDQHYTAEDERKFPNLISALMTPTRRLSFTSAIFRAITTATRTVTAARSARTKPWRT